MQTPTNKDENSQIKNNTVSDEPVIETPEDLYPTKNNKEHDKKKPEKELSLGDIEECHQIVAEDLSINSEENDILNEMNERLPIAKR